MSTSACINGFGSYVPERVLNNEELSTIVDTSDEWITSRTGIKERRLAAQDELTSDLALKASLKAIENSGFSPDEITHIILGTATGDYVFPSTATILQRKLGLKKCMALDISAACSGFVFGLELARSLLCTSPDAKILVVGAEKLSGIVNWTDRSTCVLFGDGSGAAVVSATPFAAGRGAVLEGIKCATDGTYTQLLYCNGSGSAHPLKVGDTIGPDYFLTMNGREVFKHAVRSMASICSELLDELGYTAADIDVLVPHQANLRIIEAVGQRLAVPANKVFVNVDQFGNTSAASIPLAITGALHSGFIRPGQRVLICTFGAGLTWAAGVMRF